MAKYPASVAAYGKPGGGEWKAGDTIVLRDLGRTLRAIATQGPEAFYSGWIADSIAASMTANGGLISQERSRAIPGQGSHAAARQVSRLRADHHAAADAAVVS